MRVGQLGGDVHLEIIMVGDHCIPQLQHGAALLFEGLYRRRTNRGRLGWLPLVRTGILLCPGLCSEENLKALRTEELQVSLQN